MWILFSSSDTRLICRQFDEQFLKKGEQGGKEAAGLLWGSVRDYIRRENPELPSDIRIVTRIYANLKGLSEACYKAGLVERASLIEDFARGFTGSKQLFDYIDVGSGKDRADDKLTGTSYMPSCNLDRDVLISIL